ncbi:hypothetical protein G3O06_20560 [Burkholderia sp. Ac-20345]|uniref:hypothetical protein n=1 Tax=Burkholderia sp. Ac-20345 TaxID=2703891 RepID=UPI00197B0CBC|nr:hypothetical protein [Burkholderia sp. Ac-20345]MBN3779932.1 hypothetical protein [Burkholderia sp. Ac-20345]
MTDDEQRELWGTLDGIGQTLLILIGELEVAGRIDGPGFSRRLRRFADGRDRQTAHQDSASVMRDLAERIDRAHAVRADRSA